jgi:hypothetical protein
MFLFAPQGNEFFILGCRDFFGLHGMSQNGPCFVVITQANFIGRLLNLQSVFGLHLEPKNGPVLFWNAK